MSKCFPGFRKSSLCSQLILGSPRFSGVTVLSCDSQSCAVSQWTLASSKAGHVPVAPGFHQALSQWALDSVIYVIKQFVFYER